MNRSKPKDIFLVILSIFLSLLCFSEAFSAKLNKKEEDAFYVAVKAYDDGFYDVSLTLFDRFLKTYIESDKKIEALVYIGQCYYSQEKYLKALDQFESILKTGGVERVKDKVLFWLGEIYAKGRDYRQAQSYYEELIKDYEDSYYVLSAYKSLALAQLNEGNFQRALDTYRLILSNFKDSAAAEEAFFGVCESLYRMRDYPQLKNELAAFISKFPGSSLLGRAYFYLGEANFYLNQHNEAIDAYRKSLEASSDIQQNTMSRLGLGWSYLKLKDYSRAKEIFSVFQEEDEPLGVLLGKAVLESGLGDYEKSLAFFERVIAADKGGEYSPLAYFGKAEALYNISRFDDAIIAYRISLDKLKAASSRFLGDTKELRDKILYGLAWAYLKVADFPAAQDAFQKVATLSSDKIFKLSALCQLGDTYQDAGDYKKAIETYQNFLQDYPDSIYNDYIQYQLGLTWLKMKNMDSAILAFRKLLHDYPSSKLTDDANYFIGVTYFQKGDFSAAKLQLEKFISEFKDSLYRPQAVFLLGESMVNIGDFKGSIEVFQRITKEFSTQESLRQKAEFEIANTYAAMGNTVEANKRFSDFIARYPDSQLSPNIIFLLGSGLLTQKDFSTARKYFERLIRNYPDHEFIGDAFLNIGVSFLEEGNRDAALRNLLQAKLYSKGESLARAYLLLGDVYLSKSDFSSSLKNYQEAVLLGGVWAKSAHMKMARAYREEKRYPDAIAALETALKEEGADNANAEIQFEMAEILEETGMVQDAIEAYLKVSYLYPDSKNWVVKGLLRVAGIYENMENWPELKKILIKITSYDVPEVKYAQEKLSGLTEKGL